MIVKVPNCIFCGAPKTTREHVFPQWTHKYMANRKKGKTLSVRGIQNLDGSGTKLVKMPGDIRDWQIQCVCGGLNDTCNNGWMRKLEEKAAPNLEPLILGNQFYLTPIQQATIASWVALKCMVAEYEEGYITTTQEQRDQMRITQKPPVDSWAIWIARAMNKSDLPAWSSLAIKVTEIGNLDFNDAANHFNGHSTTQMIGELFIHVIRFRSNSPIPAHTWKFQIPIANKLFQIWPPVNSIMNWPGQILFPLEIDAIANSVLTYTQSEARKRTQQPFT